MVGLVCDPRPTYLRFPKARHNNNLTHNVRVMTLLSVTCKDNGRVRSGGDAVAGATGHGYVASHLGLRILLKVMAYSSSCGSCSVSCPVSFECCLWCQLYCIGTAC